MRVLSILTTIALSVLSCRAVAVTVATSSQDLAIVSVDSDYILPETLQLSPRSDISSDASLCTAILQQAFTEITPLAQQLATTITLDGITSSLQDITSTFTNITNIIKISTERIEALPVGSLQSCSDITLTFSPPTKVFLDVVTALPSLADQADLTSTLTDLLNVIKDLLRVLSTVDSTVTDSFSFITGVVNTLLSLVGGVTGGL